MHKSCRFRILSLQSLIILACLIAKASGEETFQFTYQSQATTLTEWISLLTLCLAPLIAHIIAGVPPPTYLSHRRPAWHQHLGHYNPTSILWRYFIITLRRTLSKNWSSYNMAASCALFWTDSGWDGSEDMMLRSREFCTRVPPLPRISLISISAATTLIVTIQGVQAVYAPLSGFSDGYYFFSISFQSIFYALAFLGLMRLPAALWLTDDYSYMNIDGMRVMEGESGAMEMQARLGSREESTAAVSAMSLLDQRSYPLPSSQDIFHSANSWRGILIRIVFFTPIVGVVAIFLASVGLSPTEYGQVFTATYVALVVLYFALIFGLTIIVCFYFWTGNTNSTVLPCLGTTWYKTYTGFLIFLIIVAMVVSGLETRRSSCGIYTTLRPHYDRFGCKGTDAVA